MVVALLILIVAILLFGAGIVKGFLAGAVRLIIGLVVILWAIGNVVSHYNASQAAADKATAMIEVEKDTRKMVAQAAQKPVSSLTDVIIYDTKTDWFMCGTISGTNGFGGEGGRQRFLSNGGGTTEVEKPGDKAGFDKRVALYCTFDPDGALMRD